MRCCGRRRAAGLCCLRLWRLNCAAVGDAGLQGFIACDCDDYTALQLAAQGCRATVPVAMATTLHCCEWPRAAGLHCLRLWRLHHADVRGAGLQSYSAGGGGDYTALL